MKLRYLDTWLNHRRKIANHYFEELKFTYLKLPIPSKNISHAYHLFVVRTLKRDQLREFLNKNEVDTGIHYPISLPKLNAYSYIKGNRVTKVANDLAPQILSLPMGEHLSEENIDYVCQKIIEYENKK